MTMIWCFGHGGHAEWSSTAQTEFGPRHFCPKCKAAADKMPVYTVVEYVPPVLPETPSQPVTPKRVVSTKPTVSMASWVRANKDKGVDWLIAELPSAYPDSKPGVNPKLSRGYVNCYLRGT